MILALKLYKLCPSWRYHVRRTWAMEPPFRTHWFCKHCPIKMFNGIGMAWRRTRDRAALAAKDN